MDSVSAPKKRPASFKKAVSKVGAWEVSTETGIVDIRMHNHPTYTMVCIHANIKELRQIASVFRHAADYMEGKI